MKKIAGCAESGEVVTAFGLRQLLPYCVAFLLKKSFIRPVRAVAIHEVSDVRKIRLWNKIAGVSILFVVAAQEQKTTFHF